MRTGFETPSGKVRNKYTCLRTAQLFLTAPELFLLLARAIGVRAA
jgi:hypothetical protein